MYRTGVLPLTTGPVCMITATPLTTEPGGLLASGTWVLDQDAAAAEAAAAAAQTLHSETNNLN